MTNSSAILALVALALISSSAAFAPSTALAGLGRRQPHLQSQQRRQAPAALNMALASVATSKLLEENKASVAAVATKTGTGEGVYDDLWLLRYVVAAAGDEDAAAAAVT
ncbi:hypothetical protein T484DRAFT_1867175 [Baffinella frigidus]|nr:hypothetical protein T484DRAFT_1867175 [Cryptophyta sp. CCMP2293]